MTGRYTLLFGLGLLALPATSHAQQAPAIGLAAPSDAVLEQARERQRRGRALLEGRDFNGALAEFQRVYELLQGHPRQYMALSNIGRCYQSLGQYDLAMQYYERYLREGGAAGEDRLTVEAAISALGDLLGTVNVTVQGPARAEVWVDNRRLGDAPGTLRLPGGPHSLELRATGYLTARRQLSVTARDTQSAAFVLERPRSGISPAFFATGAVLTGVVAGTGAVLGGVVLSQRSAIDARLADPSRAYLVTDDDRQPLRTLATAADITFGIAGAFGVASVILAFVTDWRGQRAAATERPPAPRAMVLPSFGGTSGLQLVGSF